MVRQLLFVKLNQRRPVKVRHWVVSGIMLLAGTAAIVPRRPAVKERVSAEAPELRVPLVLLHQEDSWQVAWDHLATPVQTASYGTLLIRDGPRSAQIHLTPTQLKEGSVVYIGLAAPVRFDLAVSGATPAPVIPAALPLTLSDPLLVPVEQSPSSVSAARRKRLAAGKPRIKARGTPRSHRRKPAQFKRTSRTRT